MIEQMEQRILDARELAWDGVSRALSDFRDAGGDPFDMMCLIRNAVMVEVNLAMVDVNRALLRSLGNRGEPDGF